MDPPNSDYEVIVAGAGPAGTSTTIRLAARGVKVLLVEQEKFPRPKLCGEFISPECQAHFRELGVETQIKSSQPAVLTDTVFYSKSGLSITVPSEWLVSRDPALGLSRATMDHELLQRARSLGAVVLEEAQVTEVLTGNGRCVGVSVRCNGQNRSYHSLVTVDATGRKRMLVRKLQQQNGNRSRRNAKPRFVAFKAHLENTREAERNCEIYSYPGGYGGLTSIEKGLANFCFIAASDDVRNCNADPEIVLREIVWKNRRAAYTLATAAARSEWLSVSLDQFGPKAVVPLAGLITVGDAAAFIDPFTGSGILMALESGALAAETTIARMRQIKCGNWDALSRDYQMRYTEKFGQRLRLAAFLRHAAFVPYFAEAAILFFRSSNRLRRKVARATRSAEMPSLAQK